MPQTKRCMKYRRFIQVSDNHRYWSFNQFDCHSFWHRFIVSVSYSIRKICFWLAVRKMAQIPKATTTIWFFIFISCSMQFVFRVRESPSLNDSCQVARTNSTGQCKFIENCPIVYEEILKQGLFPQFCGFVNRKELICCPKKSEALSVPVRISQKSKHNEISAFS